MVDAPVLLLAVVMAVSGAAGGLLSFLLDPQIMFDRRGKLSLVEGTRYALVGVIVSFTVPLFLSLAQSAIIPTIISQKDSAGNPSQHYSEMLTLAGFCIVASFSARRFVNNLSGQILSLVGKVEEKAERAEEKAERAEIRAEEAENKAEVAEALAVDPSKDQDAVAQEDEKEEASDTPAYTRKSLPELNAREIEVLRAASKLKYRTVSGIAQDAKLNQGRVSEIVRKLVSQRLLLRTKSPTSGAPRLTVSLLGRAILLDLQSRGLIDKISREVPEDPANPSDENS